MEQQKEQEQKENKKENLDCCSVNEKKENKSSPENKTQETYFPSQKSQHWMIFFIIIAAIIIAFNQIQVSAITTTLGSQAALLAPSFATPPTQKITSQNTLAAPADLSNVDVTPVTSTPMAVATVFPELKTMNDENQIVTFMIPTGTPAYSEVMGGITFDDPVTSMEYLAQWYPSLKEEIKTKNPQVWQRYINLAAAPRGISCEYCCGIGPQAIDSKGNLKCGCKHAPALQAIALGLMLRTDYNDAQVLREVMRWKTMFFPQNMASVALQVAGKDPKSLQNLPGMVGGC